MAVGHPARPTAGRRARRSPATSTRWCRRSHLSLRSCVRAFWRSLRSRVRAFARSAPRIRTVARVGRIDKAPREGEGFDLRRYAGAKNARTRERENAENARTRERKNVDCGVIFGTSVSKWLVIAALVVLLWVARGVLPPFIIAGILAYVLSPVVDELEVRTGFRRALVALGVFAAVVVVVAGLGWLAGARLGAEIRDISREGPGIIEAVVDKLTGGQAIDLFGQSLSAPDLGRRLDVALRDELGTPRQAIQVITVGFEVI